MSVKTHALEEITAADCVLSSSSFSHVINVPVERVDIAGWVSHLPNAEYQRCCPPAHIAAGATTTDDGTPMSIKVGMIGPSLMIQQYVGDITRPEHWHIVSVSHVFSPQGRTRTQVVWDLSVKAIDVSAASTPTAWSTSAEFCFGMTSGGTPDARLRGREDDCRSPESRRAASTAALSLSQTEQGRARCLTHLRSA